MYNSCKIASFLCDFAISKNHAKLHNFFMDTFAERLSKLRKRAGFKQEDFAEKVGVSVDTVRRWEGEKQEPGQGELRLIAKVLRTSINEIVGDNTEDVPEITHEKIVKPRLQRNSKKNMIVIQQGNTRLEIPATTQGYAIIRDKLREVSLNQGVSLTETDI